MNSLLYIIANQPSGAIFGDGGEASAFRPLLWRRWGDGARFAHLCGLNPSTATASIDDPTIRREIGFCRAWGMDGLIKTNAYDYRATNPLDMMRAPIRVSEHCDAWIEEAFKIAEVNVACWGMNIEEYRSDWLRSKYAWRCFGLTKDGHPKHPLYLPKSTKLIPLAA